MAMTEERVNAKAGWCSMCISDAHSMCASPTCKCPNQGRRNHAARPGQPEKHGTRSRYHAGCRCDDCKEAERDYKRRMRGQDFDTRDEREREYQQRRLRSVKPDEKAAPVIELVAEEPPETPSKLTLVEQVLVAVKQLTGNDWHRVAVMPTSRSAKALATKLANTDDGSAYEWRSADLKVFVRRVPAA